MVLAASLERDSFLEPNDLRVALPEVRRGSRRMIWLLAIIGAALFGWGVGFVMGLVLDGEHFERE